MELFVQACRCAGPLGLVVEHPSEAIATERVFRQPFVLVGSDPRMDLFLNHPDVSRRHAYLQMLGGKLFCVDLQSRTGVHWESGAKLSGWLDAGQALGIGPFLLRVLSGDNGQPSEAGTLSAASPSPEEESLPGVALEFVNRLPGPSVWRMETTFALVGRAPACRVRLMGDSVSRFHCGLVRTPLGLWVVDLFGKGGISVNDAPVRSARLEEGDRLQVGNFIIRTRYLQSSRPRVPFSHLAEDMVAAVQQAGSRDSSPAFPQTSMANSVTSETRAAPPALAETPVPPSELTLSLLPQMMPSSSDSPPANMEVVRTLLVPIAQQLGMVQQQMFEQFQQAMVMMFQMFGKLQHEQIGVIRDEMDRLHQLSREVLALQAELAKHTKPAAERPRGTLAVPGPRAPAYSPATNPASRPTPGPKPTTESKPLPLPQGLPERDMHAWLSERIASLQQERQTRWQKIVNFLGGLGGTSPPDGTL